MKQENISLEDSLSLLLKEDLVEVSNNLKIPISKSAKKQVIVKKMSDYIMNYPLNIMTKMDLPSLIRLRELAHSPNFQIKIPVNEILEDDLVNIGLVQFHYNGTQYVETIPVDFAMQITPIIDEFVEEVAQSRKTEIATIITGLINIYGIITLKSITQIYKKIDKNITIEDIRSVVKQSYSLSKVYQEKFVKLEECMTSNYIICLGQVIDDLGKAKGRQFKDFNKEDITGMDGFTPIPPYKKMKELKQLFADLGYDTEKARRIITLLWSFSNNCIGHEASLDILYHYTHGTYKKVDRDYYINLVTDYINCIPKWILKGNSLLQVANKLSLKEGAEEMKIDDNSSYDALIIQAITKSDDGPLCSCGSGKKFKVCCGNN